MFNGDAEKEAKCARGKAYTERESEKCYIVHDLFHSFVNQPLYNVCVIDSY